MRYGLISDIHGNLSALRAVLAVLTREEVDGFLCAGDVVGYGPQPNECVEVIAQLDGAGVAGNHDLIALGRLGEDGLSRLARRSLAWTRDVLAPEARDWLARLPPTA